MTYLTDFGGDRERDTPRRVYGRIDPERDDEPHVVVLDSVDANWFDEQPDEPFLDRVTADPEAEPDWIARNVSVAEVHDDAWRRAGGVDPLGEARADEWWELQLSDETPGGPVAHYTNLFAAPVPQDLVSLDRVAEELARRLDQAHSLDPIPDADAGAIAELLAGTEPATVAAVYDVGQGGCNALLDGDAALAYFDFGGGARGNRATYPRGLEEFCFHLQPPVVLSHWDEDHWSTALRSAERTQALSSDWIVPRQIPLPSTHLAFLAQLWARGRVHMWPAALKSARLGSCLVEQCGGHSRNDSGLALTWFAPHGDGRMLFPGDCRYDDIPSAAAHAFTSLVVSHHGGFTGSTFVPAPDHAPHGRLVFSYGPRNSYRHPLRDPERDHTAAWGTRGLRTPSMRSRYGHIHLHWDPNESDRRLHCDQRGLLAATQR